MSIQSLCIIGVGLIGGSVALAARRALPDVHIVGVAPEDEHEAIGAAGLDIDLHADWRPALRALELAGETNAPRLVLLATPPAAALAMLPRVAEATDGLLTDAVSVKQPFADLARDLVRPERFVPAHPLAGSHRRGAVHADADLFVGKPAVLTPTPRTDDAALRAVREFWELLGARVVEMQAADHDRAVARGSHAVHLLAALAAGLLDGDEQAQALASTGYADTTRVAAGDPALWTDIVRQNRTHVAEALDVAATLLATLRAALADGDDEAVRRLLTEAQRRRADWQARQQRG